MTTLKVLDSIGDAIETFETSWSPDASDVILETLGGFGLQDDAEAISELVRIDIERRYFNGLTCSISDYLQTFPALAMDHERTAEIAFEDFRVRSRLGHPVLRERYQAVPGVEKLDWYRELRTDTRPSMPTAKTALRNDDSDVAKLLLKIGFQLVRLLGKGAFGRVYLAKQTHLAERHVVLKLMQQSHVEPQIMATLQHTNIVPIFSYHWIDSVCVICMPYAGTVTLRSYMASIHESETRDGLSFVETIREQREHSLSQRNARTTAKDDNDLISQERLHAQSSGPAMASPELQPLQRLAGLNREQLAIFIFTRLASALAHSHARSILHGDIKPANVLLRDDGEPALLDFNLSRHSDAPTVTTVGGTYPYMSPETIRNLLDIEAPIDAQSDVYSLGVVMYEFITGRMPFTRPTTNDDAALRAALAACEHPPEWQATDQVSQSLRSIITHCLAYLPRDRYASAEQLSQDLQRHADNLPLRYVSEPVSQRLAKLGRRHPRWSSGVGVSIVLSVLLLPLLWVGWQANKNSRQLESTIRFAKFEADSNASLLQSMADPQRFQKEGVESLIAPLKQHSLLHPDAVKSWLQSDDVANEVSNHRRRIIYRQATQAGIAEWQRLVALKASDHQPLADSSQLAALIAIAKECTGADLSRALLNLESTQEDLQGNQAKANELRDAASKIELNDDDEIYLESVRLIAERKWRLASQLLTTLADRDSVPSAIRWTYLARTQYQLGEFENAKLSLTQSLEHAAKSAQLWILRGSCFGRVGDHQSAQSDFREAIRLSPRLSAAYLKLAESLMLVDRPEEAYQQLTLSLQFTADHVPTLLLRSRVAMKLGKENEAKQDQAAAYKAANLNASELLYRSEHRLASDTSGALIDIETALTLTPMAPRLLHHLAKTQTRLGRTSEAIDTLARIQAIAPDDDKVTVDRGVLLARAKRFDEAEAELSKALKASTKAPVLYQAACVCALLPNGDSHVRALGYLSAAVQRGYGAGQLAGDHDLDALRELPGYRAILKTIQLSRSSDVAPPISDTYPPELDIE